MINPFDIGDPYIEWNETNSAQESTEGSEMDNLDELKSSVVKLLVTKHEFLPEEAENAVFESAKERPDLWHVNAEAEDLANVLALEDDEE